MDSPPFVTSAVNANPCAFGFFFPYAFYPVIICLCLDLFYVSWAFVVTIWRTVREIEIKSCTFGWNEDLLRDYARKKNRREKK